MQEKVNRLKTVQARAYRNLQLEGPLDLGSLNILIGGNGAGKSNLLEMIAFLPETLRDGLPKTFTRRRNATSVVCVDLELPTQIELCWELVGSSRLTKEDLRYQLTIEVDERGLYSVKREVLEEVRPRSPSERGSYKYLDFTFGRGTATSWPGDRPGGLQRVENGLSEVLKDAQKLALGSLSSQQVYPVLEYVREQVLSWVFYNANDMDVRAIKRESAEIDALQQTLAPGGRNLGMVLYNLFQTNYDHFAENLERILRSMYEGHQGLRFPLVDSTHFELSWQLDPHRKPLKLDQISDGTIRMLCWIVALTNPRPPALICIDEPELGIHPAWLPILADLIREAATRTQVIVSTHSPDLLDEFTHEADKIIVCSQDERGYATFERLDSEALQEWLEHYRLGQMFRSGHPALGGWPA